MFLKQSTTINVKLGPALDKTDGVTERTALTPTVEVSKAGGTFAARNSATAIAHDSNGWYTVELNTTDTNTVGPLVVKFDDAATHLPVWHVYTVLPANAYDSLVGGTDLFDVSVTQWIGTAAATPTVAGVPEVDVTHWNGTAVAAPDTAGHPKVTIKDGAGAGEINLTAGAVDTVTAVTNAVTVGTINANVITATSIAADAITAAKVAAGTIDAATFAAGAIDSAAIATDAIGSAQLSQAAANKIIQAVSGTAQSGSTTTLVDTARTEADTDYWKGSFICFTSGTISGQVRRITAFNFTTDTITFAPATTQAVATNTYIILRSSFAEILVDAIKAGAVDAAAIATDAIGASELATDAVNEIRDAVWAKAMTELAAVPGVTGTTLDAIQWLFLLARNKITQTATAQVLRNDADTVTIATSTVSDDATTFIRGEFA